ncbi:hypothetical protein [Caldanaerobius polysaccharolyticus]|uniref:hypothetical protein n=1 Tax=Caldanaerobius polysaccharolyticus TaxID=44256 RepID=UPI0004793C81|nr:hypothetical protein [Caldanaerobius polysaccharolyticus]
MFKIAEFKGDMQGFKRYVDSLITTTEVLSRENIEFEMASALQEIFNLQIEQKVAWHEVEEAKKIYEKKLHEAQRIDAEIIKLREYLTSLANDYAKKKSIA